MAKAKAPLDEKAVVEKEAVEKPVESAKSVELGKASKDEKRKGEKASDGEHTSKKEKAKIEKAKSPVEAKIQALNDKKRELIQKVKTAVKQLKYKRIELEALNKILDGYDESKVQKLQRRLKSLEFKIATRALNSRVERELVKRIMEIEKDLAKFRPMIKAKKRKKLLEEDVSKLEEEVKALEGELKTVREELRELFKKRKTEEIAKKRGISISEEREEFVTLGDIIEIEEE